MRRWKQNPRAERGLGNVHPLSSWATPQLRKPLGIDCTEDLLAQCLICLRNSFQCLRILTVRKFGVVSKFGLRSHPFPLALSSGGDGQQLDTLSSPPREHT